VFTNVCHHHRLQGKLLLRTDSVVNIDISYLYSCLRPLCMLIFYMCFYLRRMACVRAVYCLILAFVFPGKNVILAWRILLYTQEYLWRICPTHILKIYIINSISVGCGIHIITLFTHLLDCLFAVFVENKCKSNFC